MKKWKFLKNENFDKMKTLKKWKFLINENFEKMKSLKKWKFWKKIMLYVLMKEICKIEIPFSASDSMYPG